MKRSIYFLLLFCSLVYSQQSIRITYKFISNGNDVDMPRLVLEYSSASNIAHYTNAQGEEFYLDYSAGKTYQTFLLKDKSRITTIEELANYPVPDLTDKTAVIHGYNCRKAKVVIRSNNIEIWYTTEGGFKGTPSINIGPNLGFVLKIVRNGNFEISAEKVEIYEDPSGLAIPTELGEVLDMPGYKEKVTEDNFTTVRIFTDEIINFGDTIVNPEPNASNITYRFSKGTVILKKVFLPENNQGYTVFAELTEKSNGDAYDRTGSLFILDGRGINYLKAFTDGLESLPVYNTPSEKSYRGFTLTDEYFPPIELIRFITPFGIGHYNSQVTVKGIKWEDSVTYKQDVTDIVTAISGEVWFGVFIGCYDKGGHNVSFKLKYHPEEPGIEQKKVFYLPIINTLNIMEASGQEYPTIFGTDTLKVKVLVPEGVKDLKLRYISTGHGGWEHGDEFSKKMNEIFVDGKPVYKFIPWRDECGMYRKYNPASGNFPNGISSSDYSRSGWCPGSTSVPVEIPLSDLKPGEHTFSVFIPMGKPEGTSFSAWNVSAVLLGVFAP
jgi:Peptide-N-glycosidase F, N terminal/Peptide-N-glycosidase F, C terminal